MKPLQLSYNKYHGRLPIPVLAVALILLSYLATPISSCMEQEKKSLLQFLSGLSQDSGLAKSWDKATDCCKWEGVTCNRNKTIIEVSLPSRDLEGSITSLGNLTSLQHLNLSYNSLSGDLPLELVSSSSIIVLDISFNQISGDLHDLSSSTSGQPLKVFNFSSNLFTGQFTSTTWNGMENLVALNASNNSLTGQIPSHLCNISPSFVVLDLCYNKLSGSIPPGLSNCSKLKVLKAGHNQLSGSLPDELFYATMLEHLTFSSNNLQGILDGTHIAQLTNLVTLDLGENSFSGKIPDSIGLHKRLQELRLGYNSMSGELPSTLSNCINLTIIDLNNNNFSGELSKVNFSNLPNLKILDLMENNFSGKIPETIYRCHKLTVLRLSNNNFQGQLSKGLGNLKSLRFLSLAGNNFTNLANTLQILKSLKNLTTLLIGTNFMNETMPDDDTIDGFENLQVLSLRGCSLLGKIPYWLSKLTHLQMLGLSDNQLTGPIPDWISRLNYLFYLKISNNYLTGGIPTALTEMSMLKSEKTPALIDSKFFEVPIYFGTSLQYRKVNALPKMLNLANNNFIGVIPPEIGLLKELLSLNLSFNNLYGDIPQTFGNLTNLQVLDLSYNNLTGAIPIALERLHFLSEFNISRNDLEGPVPTGGQFSTFPDSSFFGNPKLCSATLMQHCNSEDAAPVPVMSTEEYTDKVIFAVAFGMFFGVGVMYDQMVLFRYIYFVSRYL